MSRTDISIIFTSYSTADTAFPALHCSAMVDMGVSAVMRTNFDIGIVASTNEPSRLVASGYPKTGKFYILGDDLNLNMLDTARWRHSSLLYNARRGPFSLR